jgi:hypothetical protein
VSNAPTAPNLRQTHFDPRPHGSRDRSKAPNAKWSLKEIEDRNKGAEASRKAGPSRDQGGEKAFTTKYRMGQNRYVIGQEVQELTNRSALPAPPGFAPSYPSTLIKRT